MRVVYSKFSSTLWDAFREDHKDRSESTFSAWPFSSFARQSGDGISAINHYTQYNTEFIYRFRPVTHFFLSPGISDFCVSNVKSLTQDYCKRLPYCVPVAAPYSPRRPHEIIHPLSYYGKGESDKIQGGFVVHFPRSERDRSVVVIPNALYPNPITKRIEGGVGDYVQIFFAANDGQHSLLINENVTEGDFFSPHNALQTSGCRGSTIWLAKLIFGLSLYMDAFPDAVVEATGEMVHKVKHYKGNRNYVGRSTFMDEDVRHSVSPHWRRGHFRLLTSEKFIHKQGQTVFVRGSFVKGKAFDVLDDAPGAATRKED